MSERIGEDLTEMTQKLSEYVDGGRAVGYHEVRKEPVIAIKPDKSKMKSLKKMESCDVHFMAVDCSTRTLKRAYNWGIYLFRTAYALVKDRDVQWGYKEKVHTVVGDAYVRRRILQDVRLNLESEIALNLVCDASESDYLLLDGASYFGGERKFWVELYEKCRKERVKLLAISKQSPMLHDEKGRDLVTATYMLSPSYPTWVYHPVKQANIHEHQYGNISLIKLSGESLRIFRCDIMQYLSNCEVTELLSPLTSLSEDPRCLGYPVTLWLAHDFSAPSDSKLLHYYDQIEDTLTSAGLLNVLRMEELSCNFSDQLHGVKHPYEREWIERV
ncbi:MAG: DNA double-strand break repair nuclease NurA [Candidatus Bathyarchaeota archaeon]